MVDTIKFSQMTSGGDIANNETTPGLKSGANVLFNNPWTFLAPGTTAQRPAPSAAINYRLRFNTDLQLYEYYNAVLGVWTQLEETAVTTGPFLTYTADPSLPEAQNLGLLANGILKQTITTGVATLNIAVNGTDFYGPGFVIPGTDGGTGIDNGALTINLGSATTGYVLTSDVSGNATWQSITASGGITSIAGDTGSAAPIAGVVVLTGSTTGLTFTGATNTLSLGGLLTSTFGGLGVSNPTAHGILVGEGASAVTPIVLTSGQILIGSTGSDPVAAAINSGTGILVANGAGSITVNLAAIATLTGLVNTTGGSAAPIATTLSTWMDAALGSSRGDILYRNATLWTVLAPGTAGFSLQTGGAGADPAYSNTFTNSTLVTPATLGVQQQALNMNSHLINNVTDPVSSQDAATKNYVDSTALNGTSVYAASAATLGTVTQSGSGVGATLTNAGVQATFALDGVNPPVGTNVLIKNTATGMTSANEGIYTVTSVGSGATNWVLTRATSYDTATEINNTGLILVQNGATLIGTAWYNAATIVTVDTTAFNYSQFGNITFPVTLANGGTSASLVAINGGVVYSTATAMAITAAGTSGQIFQSTGASPPVWSTPTWPTTAGTSGSIIISDGTNKINSTSLWPNTVGTAGKLIRSDGTVNAYTTTTWPDTFAVNTIPFASSANVIGAISAVNSAVMISSAGGVPSFSTTLPSSLTIPSPKITTGLFDVNNNLMLSFQATASSVNYITIVNQATGLSPGFISGGTDTNVGFGFQTQGTGSFTLRSGNLTNPLLIVSGTSGQHTTNFLFANTANTRNVTFPDADGTLLMTGQAISTVPSIAFSSTSGVIGTTTNDSAATGSVGEFVTSVASAVAITTATATNVTSISLTAGDWDLWGNVFTNPAAGTTQSLLAAGISTSTAAFPGQYTLLPYTAIASVNVGTTAPNIRLSLAATTTVYLVASVSYAVSTLTISGTLSARRAR